MFCRDDQTRTGDLAPPRRVRYQLRYIPIILKKECKGRQIAGYCQIYTFVFDKKSYLALFSPILIMWYAFFLLNLQIQTDAA